MVRQESRTLTELMSRRRQSEFVGRAAQLDHFRQNLSLPVDDDRRCFIYDVHGQGGVGKTSILERFRKIATEAGSVTAYLDDNQTDEIQVMDSIAGQLASRGRPLESFSGRNRIYMQHRQMLELDPDAPKSLPAFLTRTLIKGGMKVARHEASMGPLCDFVDEDALASQIGEWANYVVKRLKNKDEVRLVTEPVKVLTPLFVDDLNSIGRSTGIVLFLTSTNGLTISWIFGCKTFWTGISAGYQAAQCW